MSNKLFFKVSLGACILALFVIILGAYVRLSDAGLGCPDWPGCYGQITAPDDAEEISKARLIYPNATIDSSKAWKEMLHRYFASALGLMILIMAFIAWKHRKQKTQALYLPLLLVGLVIFQGLLGMWTVTLLLKPAIVTLHLLAGLLTLSLLFWLVLTQGKVWKKQTNTITSTSSLTRWAQISLVVLVIQIFLGGWTSTNYAALYCTDFPTCQGQWIPDTDFSEAFSFFRQTDINYEGGVLSNRAGVTVHFMHRVGALVTFILVAGLTISLLIKSDNSRVKKTSVVILLLLVTQVSLGVANVLLLLPIPVAVSHNAVAALLLLSMIVLNYLLYSPQNDRIEYST
ncbi:MAG: COX15/CtaA family protein [Gammaproteobacteria bacterium]